MEGGLTICVIARKPEVSMESLLRVGIDQRSKHVPTVKLTLHSGNAKGKGSERDGQQLGRPLFEPTPRSPPIDGSFSPPRSAQGSGEGRSLRRMVSHFGGRLKECGGEGRGRGREGVTEREDDRWSGKSWRQTHRQRNTRAGVPPALSLPPPSFDPYPHRPSSHFSVLISAEWTILPMSSGWRCLTGSRMCTGWVL